MVTLPPVAPTDFLDLKLRPGCELFSELFSSKGGVKASANVPPAAAVADSDPPEEDPEDPPEAEPPDEPLDDVPDDDEPVDDELDDESVPIVVLEDVSEIGRAHV